MLAGILHAAWEFAQCTLFYAEGRVPMVLGAMAQAVAGDVALTWLICATAGLLLRRAVSERPAAPLLELAVVATIGGILATGIELHALSSGRWRYSALMPVVPVLGVGLLPLLQLMLLPGLTLRIARRWLAPQP